MPCLHHPLSETQWNEVLSEDVVIHRCHFSLPSVCSPLEPHIFAVSSALQVLTDGYRVHGSWYKPLCLPTFERRSPEINTKFWGERITGKFNKEEMACSIWEWNCFTRIKFNKIWSPVPSMLPGPQLPSRWRNLPCFLCWSLNRVLFIKKQNKTTPKDQLPVTRLKIIDI